MPGSLELRRLSLTHNTKIATYPPTLRAAPKSFLSNSLSNQTFLNISLGKESRRHVSCVKVAGECWTKHPAWSNVRQERWEGHLAVEGHRLPTWLVRSTYFSAEHRSYNIACLVTACASTEWHVPKERARSLGRRGALVRPHIRRVRHTGAHLLPARTRHRRTSSGRVGRVQSCHGARPASPPGVLPTVSLHAAWEPARSRA